MARQYLSLHTAALASNTLSSLSSSQGTEKAPSYTSPSGTKVDAYRAILDSSLPAIDKEPDRVAQEVLTLLVGGSATTMRVMSRVVYHVNATPGVLDKLMGVLERVMRGRHEGPELEVLEKEEFLVSLWQIC